MAEILPGIHQVEGVDPSPQFTTHVYLLPERNGQFTLIDTGLPSAEAPIAAYLKKIGSSVNAVSSIVLTHLHNDHTGSVRRLKELTHAKVYAHWLEAAFIAGHPPYDGPGSPPEHPVEVDVKLKDGDTLEVGGGMVAYHTPGHTPGHTSYYLPKSKVLFSGDLFFGVPKLALSAPEYTHHTLSAQVSARRVAELPIESILNHHGGPFPRAAGAELAHLLRTF
jgi:glyoxylase-like metal-dependent hydrolase (beta-lactamase superfamily II)